MMPNNFCVFILTHGRPENVLTYDTLKNSGYTGKIYIVIDDEDKTAARYVEKFGDEVLIFCKKEAAKQTDDGECQRENKDRRAIVYARNVCFELARKVGCDYFIQLDDDYTSFNYRFNHEYDFGDWGVKKNLDALFSIYLDYYKSIPALTIAMAQSGDFIGGKNSSLAKSVKTKRKAMNTFFCCVDRPFKFTGKMNEDVTTYVTLGRKGELFLSCLNLAIHQKATQANAGGMSDMYLTSGTYMKSFSSIIFSPSCIKVAEMGAVNKRLHHHVSWENAAPRIINEKYKK
jgi:hypothetical protein